MLKTLPEGGRKLSDLLANTLRYLFTCSTLPSDCVTTDVVVGAFGARSLRSATTPLAARAKKLPRTLASSCRIPYVITSRSLKKNAWDTEPREASSSVL